MSNSTVAIPIPISALSEAAKLIRNRKQPVFSLGRESKIFLPK